MIYGFIGTGTITAAIIDGMMRSHLSSAQVIVSPRNHALAQALAERHPHVTVAQNNQAVVDSADVLVLAVRPQDAEAVVKALSIPASKKIISLIAATSHATLGAWTGQDPTRIIRAIPLPFVAHGEGVTPVFPGDRMAEDLFNAMGKAVACDTQQEFDLFAVTSALMGTYYGLLERVTDWLVAKGLPEDKARDSLVPLFKSLSQVAHAAPHASFSELREAHSTKGGLNEQVFTDFEAKGGSEALLHALDRVLIRARAAASS